MYTWKPHVPAFGEYKQQEFNKIARTSVFIHQIGDTPQLRKKSKKVSLSQIRSSLMQRKIAYTKKCLLRYRKITGVGRGIAAVQVGIPEQFAIIYTSTELMTIINPTIYAQSTKQLLYSEMCMSAAPLIASVIRPAWIAFTYYDECGNKRNWEIHDDTDNGRILNRVFEHEIDHLYGVVNIDRCKASELIFVTDPHYYKKATFTEVVS